MNNFKSFKLYLGILVFIGLLFLISQWNPSIFRNKNSINIACSDLPISLPLKISKAYNKNYHNKITIFSLSGEKISSFINNGKADVGFTVYDADNNLKSNVIGFDALVFIVNPKNKINDINLETIKKIYTGKITNWREITGSNQEIYICSEKTGNDLSKIFEKYTNLINPGQHAPNNLLKKISENTHIMSSCFESASFVEKRPGSIGFISLVNALYLKEKGIKIKILNINRVKPAFGNIINDKYSLKIPIRIFYNKQNKKTENFIDFCLSKDTQNILQDLNFIPLNSDESKG